MKCFIRLVVTFSQSFLGIQVSLQSWSEPLESLHHINLHDVCKGCPVQLIRPQFFNKMSDCATNITLLKTTLTHSWPNPILLSYNIKDLFINNHHPLRDEDLHSQPGKWGNGNFGLSRHDLNVRI